MRKLLAHRVVSKDKSQQGTELFSHKDAPPCLTPQASHQRLPGLTAPWMPHLGGKNASEPSSHMHLKFLLGFSNRPCLYSRFVRHHREENQSRKIPCFSAQNSGHIFTSLSSGASSSVTDRTPLLCPERKSPAQALIILSKLFLRGLPVLVGRNYNRKAGGEMSQSRT